jgi:hypothetical protein
MAACFASSNASSTQTEISTSGAVVSNEQRNHADYGRGRRVAGRPGTLADLGAIVKHVVSDQRFQALSHRSARALILALVEFADKEGRWWVKHETLADAVGFELRTTQRAVEEFTSSKHAHLVDPPRPLVSVQPWLRPPGAGGGPQGANTYTLDPALVSTRLDRTDEALGLDRPDEPASPDALDDPIGLDRTDEPEPCLNEIENDVVVLDRMIEEELPGFTTPQRERAHKDPARAIAWIKRSSEPDVHNPCAYVDSQLRGDTWPVLPKPTNGKRTINLAEAWRRYVDGFAWDETFTDHMILEELRTRRRGFAGDLTDIDALALWQTKRDERFAVAA